MISPRDAVVKLVRLHVAAGRVWYGHDGSLCVDSGLGPAAFVDSLSAVGLPLHAVAAFRVLGTADNASLIVKLQEARLRSSACFRIEVGSPGLLAASRSLQEPAKALQALWQPEGRGMASGGLHELAVGDCAAYFMLQAVQGDRVSDQAAKALRYHPAWPAISFLPRYSVPSAVKMLNEIVDPRWFRHPVRPHRTNRLLAWLGITPKNMAAICGNGTKDRHHERAAYVVGTWFNARTDKSCPGYRAPNDFLWRVFITATPALGMLRACRRLVRFVWEVWLGGISAERREGGFLPESFFKSGDERFAYAAHVQALGGKRQSSG